MPDSRKFPFKLGADPEFNFVVQNRQTGRLRADSLMKDFFRDMSPRSGGYDIPGGNAGWDGASATGEIRPKPADSPSGLTANIGKIYKEICKRSPSAVKLTVRCDTAPVGGHIHFELDDVSKAMSDQKARMVTKRLSSFYQIIALGEDPTNLALRLNTNYGKFSDWRRENGKTFEYRAPSAEWQLTPKICEATLAFMGTVWYEAVHKPKSFKNMDLIYTNDRAGSSLQNLALSGYKPALRGIVSDTKKAIKSFEYYPMFKEEIDYLMNYERVLKDKKAALFCINLGWGFEVAKAPTKKLINNEAQIRRNLRSIDIDRWLELFKIPFNPDTNVKDFVDALKKRILAYDWSLNNEYYMFGLKKGIKKPIVMNGNFQFLVGQDQIKTIRDRDSVTESFRRMKQRMERAFRGAAEKSILIGLPYDARLKRETRPVIDLIYDLEKTPDSYPPTMPKDNALSNDIDVPLEDWGEIARAYNTQETEGIQVEAPEHNRSIDTFTTEADVDYDEDEDEDECSNCGAPGGDCDC